jgi:hypothetical protein
MIAPNIALTARHCDLNAPYVWHWSGELQIDSVGQLEDLVISGDMRQQVRAVYPAPDRDVAVVEFDSAQPGGFALVSSMESAGWWRNFESSGAAGGYECRTNYVGLFGGWVSDETDDFGPLTKLFSTNAGLDIEPGDSGGPAFWVDDAGAMRVVGVVHGPGGPVLFPSFQYDVFSYVGDFTPACAMVSRESCVAQPLCAWYECTESCQAAGTPIEAVCGCRDQTTLEGCNEAGCAWYACANGCWPKGSPLDQVCQDCGANATLEACNADKPYCAWYSCTESCQAAGTPIEAVCGCRDQTTLEGCNEAGCAWYACANGCWPKGSPLDQVCQDCGANATREACNADKPYCAWSCDGTCRSAGTSPEEGCGGPGPIGLADCRAHDNDANACGAQPGCSYRACGGTCWPTCVGDAQACSECSGKGSLLCALTVGCEWRGAPVGCVNRDIPSTCP